MQNISNENKKSSNFSLPTINGEQFKLSDIKDKYILINFWAGWCSPCLKEMPDMQKMYSNIDKSKLELIAIHAGPIDDQTLQYIRAQAFDFPIIVDEKTSLSGWEVPALPVTYLVSPDGSILYKALGPRNWSSDQLNTLIAH
jgi:thiol-disulfide isomerase/thioredoxin